MRSTRRRNPIVATSLALRGRDRLKYLDEVWPMLVQTYLEGTGKVPHKEPDELVKDYPLWELYFHDDGRVAAFVLSKETPYGLKHAASGSDGSLDGKDTMKDILRRNFHAPGVYGETSHKVEHVAAKGDPPVVCSVEVARVLGKKIRPSEDGIHYVRHITDVGDVEKVMMGRPLGIETTRYSQPSCPVPPDGELLPNPRRQPLRAPSTTPTKKRPLSRSAPAPRGVPPRLAPTRRLRRNPEDGGVIHDLMGKLMEFKYAVMDAAGDDPESTRFDVNEYPVSKYALQSYLDVPVLGWGATRVVVRLPSGNVAKLPWGDEEQDTNVREWENWQEASPEVRQMLLPPLELTYGVIVFPHVKTVEDRDYDDPALEAARKKWAKLWNARAPGANASDFQRNANWGIYDGRLVLIDYAD